MWKKKNKAADLQLNHFKRSVKGKSSAGEDLKTLYFRNGKKSDDKVPRSDRSKNIYGCYMQAFTWEKFGHNNEAPHYWCPYSKAELVTNKDTSEYGTHKRSDISKPLAVREAKKTLWVAKQITDEGVDMFKLMNEAGKLLQILDGKGNMTDNGEIMSSTGEENHGRCHVTNVKGVRKKEKQIGRKNKLDHMWREDCISELNLIMVTNIINQQLKPDESPHMKTNIFMEMQLDKYLQNEYKRVPEQMLVQFAYQVCLGVKWLHDNNLVYRDLRARNVLVFKRDSNWLARITCPGSGSLVKYIRDGYGWRNIRNPNLSRDNNMSQQRASYMGAKNVGPLERPMTVNDFSTNQFKKLSLPPGSDGRGRKQVKKGPADFRDDYEMERSISINRRKENQTKLVRRGSMSDMGTITDFTMEGSKDDAISDSHASLSSIPGTTLPRRLSQSSRCSSTGSVNGYKSNPSAIKEQYIVNAYKGDNFDERRIRQNEESVYHQPPEIHDKMRKLFASHSLHASMAPAKREQELRANEGALNAQFSKRTDIYSLGCIFWEIMTYGRTPFRPKNYETTLDADKIIKSGVFAATNYVLERPSFHQNAMCGLIKKCMNVEPALRPGIDIIAKYYMTNVLSENGIEPATAQCQCGRFLEKEKRKTFLFF